MTDTRRVVAFAAIVAAGMLSGCAQRVRTPERPGQTLVALLPDADTGKTGRATVSNTSGATNLEQTRDSTIASGGAPPSPAATLSQSEVNRIFKEALSALPPAPQRFTLYFRFESNELTEESRAKLPEIRNALKERPIPEVAIIGHTDTTGTPAANFGLGRARAVMIRDLLVAAGLDAAVIDIASHGESDLEVPTADNTLEPRNRRVEISVR